MATMCNDHLKDPIVRQLCESAVQAIKVAYCPYSDFSVGAALLCDDGTIYKGSNVECASLGNTICAERTAIVKAVSEGKQKFKAIAVTTAKLDDPVAPCGICRQFMIEFGDYDVYLVTRNLEKIMKTTTRELLPLAFTPDDLKKTFGQ